MTEAQGDDRSAWVALEAAFAELADLPVDEQAQRLAALDLPPELMARLRALLDADRTSHDVIGSAIAAVVSAPSGPPPTEVGPWRLLRSLGVGGMGTVYLAERADEAYQAQVAIKFLRGTLATPDLERRFRAERQFLATLDHPGIARLIDGGTAPDGTPYFVMEYVDGEPLDTWCDAHHLDVRARVALVQRICDAVQHAHQGFVVHRDLKPANILVTADGSPKLLDFGIARLVDDSREGRDLTFYQAMTPSYASPEQLRGGVITTASDVWSLGVILFRLLAGVPPHDLDGLSAAEVERRVTTTPAPPPSHHAPAARSRELRGELDTIVRKALQVDAAQRYRTAADFAEDLRRWLAREPILARRPTAAYRTWSFVRRHPLGVGASVAAVLALAALTATSLVQAGRARDAAERAAAGQRTAEQATNELVELLNLADPNISGGETITARGMLDRGATRILTGQTTDPDVRVSLAIALAAVYRNLAAYDSAGPLLDTALAIRTRTHGPASSAYAQVLHEYSTLQYALGNYDSTAALERRVLDIQRVAAPGDNAVTEAALEGLGTALDETGEYVEAEQHLRAALAMARVVHGDSAMEVANDLLSLAAVLRAQARYDDAVPLLEESVVVATQVRGRRNLDVANALNHLARTHSLAGRHEAAIPIVKEAIDIQATVHGKPHPETAASLGNLAGILANLARLDESRVVRLQSHEMLMAYFGRSHPYIGASFTAIGDLAFRQQDWQGALAAYREARVIQEATLPPNNPQRGTALTGIGRSLLALGRASEAEAPLRAAYRVRAAGLPKGHWHIAASALPLGECLLALRRPAEAEPLLREAAQLLEATFTVADGRARQARVALANALRALGRTASADSVAAIRDSTDAR
ncbi:MAG: serine/threonine protein kinase [Gemmatimonadetes bacterium]|nr:serine/threonine protein kinase [Gemmatimonadota bacterium]